VLEETHPSVPGLYTLHRKLLFLNTQGLLKDYPSLLVLKKCRNEFLHSSQITMPVDVDWVFQLVKNELANLGYSVLDFDA
jgi:hypothetical protein